MYEDNLQLLRKELEQVSLEFINFCENSFANKTIV